MEKFKLLKPTLEYEKQAIEYMKEQIEHNSEIAGVGGLDRYLENYEQWLEKLEEDRNRKKQKKEYQQKHSFWCEKMTTK